MTPGMGKGDNMRKVRLGVIGAGYIGKTHINNILSGCCPEIEVTAVADAMDGNLKWAKEKIGSSVAVFKNEDEFFDSGRMDAVLVAVPHYDHPRLAIEAFRRGLHVMIEKPAGVYTKQVREMNEASKKAGVKFGIMYNQRTDKVFRRMREIVKSGSFGQIRRTNWIATEWYRPQAYYNSAAWRGTWKGEGGGVLLNQCPHNLDIWQWICGMPVLVEAHMKFGKWHDIEVEDDVTAYVEFENGATGVFVTSTGDTPGTNRFEITLDKGKLVAENGVLTIWENEVCEQEFSRTNTEHFGKPKCTTQEVRSDGALGHAEVLNAFAGAILRGEPLIAEGVEGINGLTLSNAMHLSAWLKKEVSIPFDEELFYSLLLKASDK